MTLLPLLAGCTTGLPHSILDPAGAHAHHIERLWWEMFVVYGIVFVITLLLLGGALLARKRASSPLGMRFVFVSGIAIPAAILVVMLIRDVQTHKRMAEHEPGFHVQVIGHMWWFETRYPEYGIVDANEIHVPAGVVVRFELSASDMIHSFWVPRLGGKRDQLPDHPTYLDLVADQPGVYYGTCTEYCAGQHARMDFRLVAHPPEEFERWLDHRRKPPPLPDDPRLRAGREVFLHGGCAACHTVRGASRAEIGPDLTHLGSRLTLGAGQFENNVGNLSGWIANSQAMKPGNQMPRTYLGPEDLHALVDYLRSLK